MPRQVASVVRGSVLRSRVSSLAKTCSIGLKSGEQEEQLGAGAEDQLANRLALLAAEVIHDDNVAGAEGGHQELFDVSTEAGAVDRPVDDAGGGDPVAAQSRQKGQCPPAAVRQLSDQAAATWRAPVAAGHIGLSPGFVDEHQPLGVKPALVFLPLGPPTGDVGAVLFTGVQAFF